VVEHTPACLPLLRLCHSTHVSGDLPTRVCVCVCVCVCVLLQLDGYDLLLQQPDPDVYNWITGKYEVPTELQGSFMDKLLEHVNRNPLDTLRNG
jgi:Flavinator of succinate dehydrogenase